MSELDFLYYFVQTSSSLFGRALPSFATSTPFHPAARQPLATPTDQTQLLSTRSSNTTASSGISSIHSEMKSSDPTPVPQSFIPRYAKFKQF